MANTSEEKERPRRVSDEMKERNTHTDPDETHPEHDVQVLPKDVSFVGGMLVIFTRPRSGK